MVSSHSYGGGGIKRVASAQASSGPSPGNGSSEKQPRGGMHVTSSPPMDHSHHPNHFNNNNNNNNGNGNTNRRDYSNGSHSLVSADSAGNNNGRLMHGNYGGAENIGPHEILACNGSEEAVRECG